MDFRQSLQNAGNRAESREETTGPRASSEHSSSSKNSSGGKGPKVSGLDLQSIFNGVLLVGVTVLLALLALSFITKGANGESKYVDSSKYQAVFLNNGQVYFGSIVKINSQFLDLQSVYYLTQNTAATANGTAATGDYTLVKLGCQQIHNPADQMVINRDQVSFWENLEDSGKVVTSIKEFIKQNPKGPDCTQVSTQTQSSNNTSTSTQTSTNPAQKATTSTQAPTAAPTTTKPTTTTPTTTR